MNQKTIDFTRGEQLSILNQFCRSIPTKGVRVQEGQKTVGIRKLSLSAVLRVIDDLAPKNGACFASQETIGNLTGLSSRTIRRVLNWLDDAGLVIRVHRGKKRTNTMRLVWNNLDGFTFTEIAKTANSDRPCDGVTGHGDRVTGHGDRVTGHGAQSDRPWVADRTEKEPQHKRNRLTEGSNRDRVFGNIDFGLFEFYLDRIGRIVTTSGISDSLLQIKVAVMLSAQVGGCLSEEDVNEALQAVSVNSPENPSAYFCTCIRKRLGLESAEFGKLLATVPVIEPADRL